MSITFKIIVILCICLIGNVIISKVCRFVTKKKQGIHITFISGILKLIWTVLSVLAITDMFTVTQTISKTILTSSSLLVAVVGFAAQQVLADVVSGLMLSWAKPFDIGEKITIKDLGISGIVESMNLRHTVVRTYHNSKLLVPNSVINKSVVENSNYDNHYIGNYLEIPISYDSDIDKAIMIMEQIIAEHPLVLDLRENKEAGKKANVYVKELGESGIVLKSTICTKDLDDNFIACSDIRKEIKKQYDKAGIKIHFRRIKIINQN
jgi:small-conductance mechanosensitive channel